MADLGAQSRGAERPRIAPPMRLDMPVEFVFRKIHDAGGKANYFWKASPVAQGAPA